MPWYASSTACRTEIARTCVCGTGLSRTRAETQTGGLHGCRYLQRPLCPLVHHLADLLGQPLVLVAMHPAQRPAADGTHNQVRAPTVGAAVVGLGEGAGVGAAVVGLGDGAAVVGLGDGAGVGVAVGGANVGVAVAVDGAGVGVAVGSGTMHISKPWYVLGWYVPKWKRSRSFSSTATPSRPSMPLFGLTPCPTSPQYALSSPVPDVAAQAVPVHVYVPSACSVHASGQRWKKS